MSFSTAPRAAHPAPQCPRLCSAAVVFFRKERRKSGSHMELTDTIAAVSTPRGKGGVAVIRISGEDAAMVLSRVFTPKKTEPTAAPRRACFGGIHTPGGEVLDEGLATFFPAPASFTGENVAEIACHGGALLTETVLAAVLAAGARGAHAGEFTRRALINGKITLSGAEALGALLDAGTAGQMALARGGMEGRLSAAVQGVYSRLSTLLADVYAKIDFPDEDLSSLSREEIILRLRDLKHTVEELSATWRTGRVVSEGVRTVICGPVNAGKSSLYNALVGRNAAIVTDVAGTTRDVLCETVALGNVTLRLFDTAGLRESEDAVEKIGVMRAVEEMNEAELILAVLDASHPAGTAESAFLASLRSLPGTVIVVLNKSDRGCRIDEAHLTGFPAVVHTSAGNGDTAELRTAVERLFLTDKIDIRHDAVVANARQYGALSRAGTALGNSLAAFEAGLPFDVASSDAELAMQALGEVDGRAVSEDIVADIFSHFCVGK